MKQVFSYTLIAAIITLLMICGSAAAEEIRCNILQYNTGRFYFPHGVETNVVSNCFFTIYNEGDSIYAGFVENSFPGVSFSYPTGVKYDTVLNDKYYAVIEAAGIDSQTVIIIGILSSNRIEQFADVNGERFSLAENRSVMRSNNGNTVQVRHFDSFFEMTLAFENSEIDCFFSYKEYIPREMAGALVSGQAMYYAAMIPNISRPVNLKGILTTSLYYRFNPDLFAYYFEGDDLMPFNGLYLNDIHSERPYEYNPVKGKKLFELVEFDGNELGINSGQADLVKLMEYFSDIISRDKLKANYKGNDLYFTYIPLDIQNPGMSLDSIHTILLIDAAVGSQAETLLDIIEDYIELGYDSDDKGAQRRYFDKAERNLMEDFGVFPLYRPKHFFITGAHIRSEGFGSDGRIDIINLKRIILPHIQEEANR